MLTAHETSLIAPLLVVLVFGMGTALLGARSEPAVLPASEGL